MKALTEQDILPSVISGTSGGAYMAALVCVRTKAEFETLLEHPDLIAKGFKPFFLLSDLRTNMLLYRLNISGDSYFAWLKRWWNTGAICNPSDFLEKIKWATMGDTTFLEAFQKTGRVLNISASPERVRYAQVILFSSFFEKKILNI